VKLTAKVWKTVCGLLASAAVASGHRDRFVETFPDEGDVDMLQAALTYREVGYEGMIDDWRFDPKRSCLVR
jgi:D-mannonate dehydratase